MIKPTTYSELTEIDTFYRVLGTFLTEFHTETFMEVLQNIEMVFFCFTNRLALKRKMG